LRHTKRALAIAGGMIAVALMAACLPSPANATYQWGHYISTPTLFNGQNGHPNVTGEIGIDAGKVGNVAINADGTVEGWGLSWGTVDLRQMPPLQHVVQAEDGNDNFAFLEAPSGITPGVCPTDTSVWTVGPNIGGDLGLGDPNNDLYATPQRVTTLDGLGVVQIAAAGQHMFALTCNGNIYMWGENEQGALDMPKSYTGSLTPTLNVALSGLTGGTSTGVEITTGSLSSDLLVNGQAYGWGLNNVDQCGCGSTDHNVYVATPVLQGGVAYSSIDGGGDLYNGHTLALDAQGNAYCWGDGQEGECGLGTASVVATPTQVPGLPALSQALAGGAYSLFLDTNGTVWACGYNAQGQVGNGSTANQLTPVSVLSGMAMISTGSEHDLAAN
jgi:hypothetical protein